MRQQQSDVLTAQSYRPPAPAWVGCQLFGEQLLSYVHMAVNWCRDVSRPVARRVLLRAQAL